MLPSTMRGWAAVVSAGAVAVLGALGLASIASSDDGQAVGRAAALSETRADTLQRYAVLQDPSRRATGETVAKAQSALAQAFHITPAESARAVVATAREDAAARVTVTGLQANGVCLSVSDHGSDSGSVGCTDTAYAGDAAHPLIAVDSVGEGRTRVTALLVDGISSLTVTGQDDARDVRVSDNVATAVVDSGPLTLSWTDQDGAEHRVSTTAG